MRAVAEADRGRRAADFLDRDDMFEVAEREPAIFLLDGDAVQAEFAHRRPEIAREPVLGVDLRGERRDLVGGETLRRLADHVGGLTEPEIEPGVVIYGHGLSRYLVADRLRRGRRSSEASYLRQTTSRKA